MSSCQPWSSVSMLMFLYGPVITCRYVPMCKRHHVHVSRHRADMSPLSMAMRPHRHVSPWPKVSMLKCRRLACRLLFCRKLKCSYAHMSTEYPAVCLRVFYCYGSQTETIAPPCLLCYTSLLSDCTSYCELLRKCIIITVRFGIQNAQLSGIFMRIKVILKWCGSYPPIFLVRILQIWSTVNCSRPCSFVLRRRKSVGDVSKTQLNSGVWWRAWRSINTAVSNARNRVVFFSIYAVIDCYNK